MVKKPTKEHKKAILCGLYIKTRGSTHTHFPLEYILKNLIHKWIVESDQRVLRKALKELVNEGLLWEKSHGKTRSYGLTKLGVRRAKEICFE